MTKTIARYNTTFGLSGCYMPDYVGSPMEFTTRKQLAEFIRYEIDMHGLPAYLFKDVKITKLWSFIKRNGSSSAHFALYHKGNVLQFSGLTEEEFEQQSEDY